MQAAPRAHPAPRTAASVRDAPAAWGHRLAADVAGVRKRLLQVAGVPSPHSPVSSWNADLA
jgi:hypothetical protein